MGTERMLVNEKLILYLKELSFYQCYELCELYGLHCVCILLFNCKLKYLVIKIKT